MHCKRIRTCKGKVTWRPFRESTERHACVRQKTLLEDAKLRREPQLRSIPQTTLLTLRTKSRKEVSDGETLMRVRVRARVRVTGSGVRDP